MKCHQKWFSLHSVVQRSDTDGSLRSWEPALLWWLCCLTYHPGNADRVGLISGLHNSKCRDNIALLLYPCECTEPAGLFASPDVAYSWD